MFNDITGEVVMDKKFLKYIGHDLYNVKKLKERKRYIVYLFFIPQKSEMIRFSFDFLFVMKSWG